MIGIPQDRHSRNRRHRVLEEFNGFSSQRIMDLRQPSDVASWPAKARDDATCNRIIAYDDDNGNRVTFSRLSL
jgi:hypothetical protein